MPRLRNHEYYTIDHQRCGFDDRTGDVELFDPSDSQLGNVCGSNFGERRMSPSIIRAGIHQPFIRIGSGGSQAFAIHVNSQSRRFRFMIRGRVSLQHFHVGDHLQEFAWR